MKAFRSAVSWQLVYTSLLTGSLMLLALSRYLHLSADFPADLGVGPALYTDEGWWARNALNWVRNGHWYVDDGYNPIVSLPVLPLLQTVWFKVFGVSLSVARALTATCTVVVSFLVFLIARSEIDRRFVWIAPFIVLGNYAIFAFSRLALLEMPMLMFMLLSIWLLLKSNNNLTLLMSSAAFLAAVLTKTTAVFALPIVLYLIFVGTPQSLPLKIRFCFVWLLFFGLGYGLYSLLFVQAQAPSASYFSGYNVAGKLIYKDVFNFLNGPPRAIKRSLQIFPILFPCLLWVIATLTRIKAYQRSLLFQISVLWSVFAIGLFSISNYAPPRYFVVLIVPIALCIPLALQALFSSGSAAAVSSIGRRLFLSAVVVAMVVSLGRTSLYLRSPEFSFVNMASAISAQVAQQPGIVMGKFADTLALASPAGTPITSINDKMGFRSLDYRLNKFQPNYYVFIGSVQENGFVEDCDYSIPAMIQRQYQLQLVDTFDVFRNRVYQRPVFLYRMSPDMEP